MDSFDTSPVELIGYAASLGVLLSFFMKDIIALRIVNSVGCALFVLYGILLPTIPVALTNGAIIVVNVYYIWKKKK